jgi:quercetin dioxygenase-like cupin family protein
MTDQRESAIAHIGVSRPIQRTPPDMEHPIPIHPRDHAVYSPDRMGKSTIFRSERMMVGLNAFEPGQEHALHAHEGMDKVYHVIEGEGLFLLEAGDVPLQAGVLLVAPEGVPHGIRNTGRGRLLVLAILAPAP